MTGIKLEIGKSYKTRGGWRAVPHYYDDGMYKVVHHVNGHNETTPIWHYRDGRSNLLAKDYDLIEEWIELMDLTKIEKPFGLLDKETQERLKAHGGPYQFYHSGGWFDEEGEFKGQFDYWVWRVKPKPVVEYKKADFVTSKYTGYAYQVTEKFVDGKYDSHTVDMVPF